MEYFGIIELPPPIMLTWMMESNCTIVCLRLFSCSFELLQHRWLCSTSQYQTHITRVKREIDRSFRPCSISSDHQPHDQFFDHGLHFESDAGFLSVGDRINVNHSFTSSLCLPSPRTVSPGIEKRKIWNCCHRRNFMAGSILG